MFNKSKIQTNRERRRHFLRGRAALAAAALMLPLAGCDEILDVEDPDITLPGNFVDETALPAIRAAAIGDFAVAYSGSTDGNSQILYSGLLADEWIHSGTFPTRKEVDVRRILDTNATLQTVTRTLYRARTSAESAAENFANLGPNTSGHAEVLNLAGFTYIFFGENYCSGIPFSELTDAGGFEFGAPETTTQVLERAVARFEAAAAAASAAGSAQQENLARVGLGRALLNLGRYAEAAAAVSEVPTDFEYLITHSDNTAREQNVVFNFSTLQERWSVANREGVNGLPYRDDNDPRVPWTRNPPNDVGFDGSTPQFDQLLYPSRDADAVLASGIEARLIEAEVALANGDALTAFLILNDLRASVGLGPLVDPISSEERVDVLFKERAYWLWLTSHRLGDLRRLVRQYGRDTESVYPTGSYFKTGEPYGPDVSFPLPVDEENNPNFVQCDNTIA